MKTIGLVGGLTWLSTVEYYRTINQMVNERRGGVEAAEIIVYSVNFAEIKKLTEEDHWDEIANLIGNVAQKLEKSGAECILLGANTMHKIADEVKTHIHVPLIHIAEATAEEVVGRGCKTVALLGTKYTMQLSFYRDKLSERGIQTIIPGENDIQFINSAIYNEMGKGQFLPSTKKRFIEIIGQLAKNGAEGIILGCTEIPLLVKQEECNIPLFDTTLIHSKAAVDFALQ